MSRGNTSSWSVAALVRWPGRLLDRQANDQGINLAFVELRDRFQELLVRHRLFETLDRDHFYPSVDAALAAITADCETRATEHESDE